MQPLITDLLAENKKISFRLECPGTAIYKRIVH